MGPEPFSGPVNESYAEDASARLVDEFDTMCTEIPYGDGDRSRLWYAANGLFATELTAGRRALGDASFQP